jgi:hypothetical protein
MQSNIAVLPDESFRVISLHRETLCPQAQQLFDRILTYGQEPLTLFKPTWIDNCSSSEHLYSRDAITDLSSLPKDHMLIANHKELIADIERIGELMDQFNAQYFRLVTN